jgi:hypothetical protein
MKKWLHVFLLLIATTYTTAAEPVYVGYYRGSPKIMPPGLYSFTDITDPAGSATQIGRLSFPGANWQKTAFDGTRRLTFFRAVSGAPRDGAGLYDAGTLSSISKNSDSGTACTFSDWHGIATSGPFFYGLYDGNAMTGSGLYRFEDSTDPESTAVRLFPSQTFPAATWSDVAVDGERVLFVKTAVEGDPGIYQYNPQTDSFTRISGAENYTDWDGLGAYTETPPEPLSASLDHMDKTIYVVLLGGQSNALGWGYHQYLLDIGSPLADPQTDIDLFTGVEQFLPQHTLTPLQSGSANARIKGGKLQQYPAITNAPVSRFGPELSMGRTVRDLIHDPDSRVAVIKHAVGGSNLYQQWLPDGTSSRAADGPIYQDFQITVQKGIAALQTRYPDYGIKILGMGWVQGEADADNQGGIHAADYQANLTALIADLRETIDPDLVFVLSKLSPNQSTRANYEIIRTAQQAVADADPRVVATETTGTNYLTAAGFPEGGVHYLSASYLQIGRDLGQALVAAGGLPNK